MNLAWIAAAATGAAAFWGSVKAWMDTALSLVWVRARVQYPASGMLLAYLERNYRRATIGSICISAFREYVRPRGRREWVGNYQPGEREWFFRGLAFIVVSALKDRERGDTSFNVDVSHIRGLFNVATLTDAAIEDFNERSGGNAQRGSRYRVRAHFGMQRYRNAQEAPAPLGSPATHAQDAADDDTTRLRPIRWKVSDLGAPTDAEPFQGLVFPVNVEEALNRIRQWRKSEVFYRERRIPWRMGVLLHGLPGTGKTSLARAVAQELDLPVHTFDLAGMENRELRYAWQECAQDAPAVALIEDVDRVFRGRENIVAESRLTLDMLLNCISGVEPSEGVLTILTCNDTAALDPALTRPGRMDVVLEFGPMTQPDKAELAKAILGNVQPSDLYDIAVNEALVTPAQVQAYCAEIALARLYQQQ